MPQSFQAPVHIGEHEKKLAAAEKPAAEEILVTSDKRTMSDIKVSAAALQALQPKKGKGKK